MSAAEVVQVVIALLGMLMGAGAVYGGIRSDLRNMREAVQHARETADSAHRRIDDHIAGDASWRRHQER